VHPPKPQRTIFGDNLPDVVEASDESDSQDNIEIISNDIKQSSDGSIH
jgi:hypothetical protein